jgi:hypothetical protein
MQTQQHTNSLQDQQHHTTPYNTIQHHTTPHNTTQHHTTPQNTIQHHTTPTTPQNTTQHHTTPTTPHNTNNTIQHLTRRKPNPNHFSSSAVYKLTCPECDKAYVGQTGSRFSLCYNEHNRALCNNSPSSSFPQHFLVEAHPFGPIHDIMKILRHRKKGPHLNTMEKFHIYTKYKNGSHLNDEHTIFPNKIFDSLIKPCSSRTPP